MEDHHGVQEKECQEKEDHALGEMEYHHVHCALQEKKHHFALQEKKDHLALQEKEDHRTQQEKEY